MLRRLWILAVAVTAMSAGSAAAGWDGPLVPASHKSSAPCGGCEAPAAAPCATAAAPCDTGCDKDRGGLLKGLCHKTSGTAMPVGCSCLAAEKTFLFGGCNQFFNPGKTCGGRSGLFGRCGACAIGAEGTGGLGCHNPCVYGSYLNR